jgi:outer membrane protein TolC
VLILFTAAIVGGCSGQDYRKWADRDVERLLKSRQERVIGYEAQVKAESTVEPQVPKKAYEKLPFTPVAPQRDSPLTRSTIDRVAKPLGPPAPVGPWAEPLDRSMLSLDDARRPAQERLRLGPHAQISPAVVLDLFGALSYAVQNSRDYRTRMEDLYLSALTVTLQRHLFEPRPFVRQNFQYSGGQEDVNYRSALTATSTVGVRQQLPYGGEIVAQGLVSFVQALNDNSTDGETASVALNASIPLLRGAGMVNLESLIQSERDLIYAIRTFETYRRTFAVDIASRYLRLLSSQQAISNRRFQYLSLVQLTERTQALYSSGRLNFLQVQRALQSQLTAENALIDAIQSYENALDSFKIVIGMPIEEPLEIVAVALDVNAPEIERADVAELALRYRLDLRTAEDRVDDARRAVSNSQNALLPDVTLSAGATLGNRRNESASEIDSRTLTYNAGLSIDVPVDQIAERNAYRRSLIQLERQQRSFTQTRDQIVSDVRAALRGIRSAKTSLEIQRRNVELNQRRLDFANELLTLGRAQDSREVVDAQQALLDAQDRLDRAYADFQIQVLQFLRDTGLLRVDPHAGVLGNALTRYDVNTGRPVNEGR